LKIKKRKKVIFFFRFVFTSTGDFADLFYLIFYPVEKRKFRVNFKLSNLKSQINLSIGELKKEQKDGYESLNSQISELKNKIKLL